MTAKKESTSNNTDRPQDAASSRPGTHADRLPPSYDALYPPAANAAPNTSGSPRHETASTQGTEDINTLRSRNPRLALDPPLPKHTPLENAEAAARTAVLGLSRAFAQTDRYLLVAHTAHAIAVAVSTSRSYTAFLAATTAAEGVALAIAEGNRNNTPKAGQIERGRNALRLAAESAVAADAGNTPTGSWPSSTHHPDAMPPSQPQPASDAQGRS